ncbi:CD225/dispanin family protein [Sphingobacterium wenxiniae]|uniref:GYF domain-containing protein n=1 Tax=Sphingobacterium wenxiniae TaxID=683125 RepID=A0A1I6R9R2_9SPHI|nr:CD225/dispanin family protein [Sphingobacterium wenxiniae]SFS61300.1 protein of unknown function [Sphingobacterium wenxiniae]
MKKYHYSDGTNSFGPFSIEELAHKGLTPDTFVWEAGFPNWVKAKEVPELASLFAHTDLANPAPYYTNPYSNAPSLPNAQPPKNYLIETIITTIFCCLPLGIVSIVYASRVEKKFYSGDTIGAENDSANAKKWLWINVGVTIALYILQFIFFGTAIFMALLEGGSY